MARAGPTTGRGRMWLVFFLAVLVVGAGWLTVAFGVWISRNPVEQALAVADSDLDDGLAALRDYREAEGRYPADLVELATKTGWRAPVYKTSDFAFLGLVPVAGLADVSVVYTALPTSDSFALGVSVSGGHQGALHSSMWFFDALTGPEGPVKRHPEGSEGAPPVVDTLDRYTVFDVE